MPRILLHSAAALALALIAAAAAAQRPTAAQAGAADATHASAPTSPDGGSAPRNVLIVLVDDVGIENIGAYGFGTAPPPTPTIDALAASGVLFRNAWANPVCSPTRACIQTGRYSFRTGVGTAYLPNGNVLAHSEVTIPEVLDREGSGYAHAAFGKWHLSDNRNGGPRGPNLAGWSYYAGAYYGLPSYFQWQRTVNGVEQWVSTYATTQNVDDALAWIRDQTKPWVIYLAFNASHTPFHAPPQHLHSYSLSGLRVETHPELFHKAAIEAMDRELGRLLAGLGPALADTEIIFLSDNGTPSEAAEPPYTSNTVKGTPYQGGVGVPMIIAGPSVVAPGRVVDNIVGAVDVFATVAELCGVTAESRWLASDSVSLVPYLTNPSQPPLRQHVLAELFLGSEPNTNGWAAIRDDAFKLIRYYGSARQQELYDLVADPLESNNLLLGELTPAQSARWASLQAALNALREPPGSIATWGSASCAGSAGVLRISGRGEPRLGGSYVVELQGGAALQPCALVIGASRTRWAGGALPWSLAALGAPAGCMLYASPDLLALTSTDSTGSASLSLSLPTSPALVAGTAHHTWVVADPAAPGNPLRLTTSDGATATFGR